MQMTQSTDDSSDSSFDSFDEIHERNMIIYCISDSPRNNHLCNKPIFTIIVFNSFLFLSLYCAFVEMQSVIFKATDGDH